jgi:hypothetical protein
LAPWATMQGIRLLHINEMQPSFFLHLRDGLTRIPKLTYTILAVALVAVLAYILRVFERPYYYAAYWDPSTSTVTNDEFVNYENSIWCTVITMTTVGYGDVYAVTTWGRITSLVIAFTGTVMISLLVATMSLKLMLQPNEVRVLNEIQEQATAAQAIQHSMQYNILLKKRYAKKKASDERPTFAQVREAKKETINKTDKFKVVRKRRTQEVQTNEILFKHTLDLQAIHERQENLESNMEDIKGDIADIHKKLDLFLYSFFNQGKTEVGKSDSTSVLDKISGQLPTTQTLDHSDKVEIKHFMQRFNTLAS